MIRQLAEDCRVTDDSVEPLLQRLRESTLSGALSAVTPPATGLMTLRVQHNLHALLRTLARRGPVALAIDDSQHMDTASMQCLLYAIRRLRSLPVLLVVATSNALQAAAYLHTELLREPEAELLRLKPLSRDGTRRLMAAELEPPTALALADAVHAVSGGSPLFVTALIDDALHPQAASSAEGPAVGDAYRRAVLSCLRRSPEAATLLAAGIAVLGDGRTPVMLAQLVGLAPEVQEHLLAALAGARILQDGDFRHPRACAAVLGNLSPTERIELHRRAAELLRRHGAPPHVLARHLARSGPSHSTWAAATLHEAAQQAIDENDADTAQEWLNLASWAATDGREIAAITALRLELAWANDPSEADVYLTQLVEAARDRQLDIRHLALLVHCLLWAGRNQDAAEALGALADPPVDPSGRYTLEAAAMRAMLSYNYPVLAEMVPEHSCPSPDVRRRLATLWPELTARLQAATALADVLFNRADRQAADTARRILRDTWLSRRSLSAVVAALQALIYLEEMADAEELCDALLDSPALGMMPTGKALLWSIRAEIHLRRGDLAQAERLARDALELLSPAAWGVGIGWPLATLVTATTRMGKHDEAAAYLDHPIPDALLESKVGLAYRHARGLLHLAVDRPRSALNDFLACADRLEAWQLHAVTLVPWRLGAAEAWLRMNRPVQARQLLEEQLTLLGGGHRRTRGSTLRLLARTAEPGERLPMVYNAVELQQYAGDQYELLLALVDSAKAHGALGDTRRARAQTENAEQIAAHIGLSGLSDLSGPKLSAKRTSRVDAGVLTNAERRTALLAASGHTNREIAKQLYVTMSTVEQHLTRVFRKLSVKRREDLAVVLGRQRFSSS